MENTRGAVDITVDTFGGLSLETGPPDTPQGLASDCQDVAFDPGSVRQRPCLNRILSPAIAGNPSVTYTKTYVQPDETPLNLILDSDGNLWRENVDSTPGTKTLIKQLVSNSYANSVSAFGREYIALNDGIHGTDVPLQYDGTNLDRVSQDGPGANASATEEDVSFTIAPAATGLVRFPNAIVASPGGLSQSGHTVTVNTPSFLWFGSGVAVGDTFTIAGATDASYDGTWTVSALISNTIGGSSFQFIHPSTGLAASGGGTATLFAGAVTTTAANPFVVGQLVTIAGAGDATWDGTWTVRNILTTTLFSIVMTAIPASDSGGGTVSAAGTIATGVHKFVVMFQTRQGYITKPSPISSWTATGSLRVIIGDLPIGPASVVARIVAFTPAGGGNFFYIPVSIASSGVSATVVPDNTSTSATFDFTDTALMAASAIDIPGNNLFALAVLGPCLGFFEYASRLFAWGERNKVQNFFNMGIDGGYLPGNPLAPSGWTIGTSGGLLVNGGAWTDGEAWQITGDGSANPLGELTQPAYQDEFGVPIILPNTRYKFRLWAKSTATAGSVVVEFQSPTSGILATATIPISSFNTVGNFAEANFDNTLPATIPSDMLISIFAQNQSNGDVLTIDELEVIYRDNPFSDTTFRGSYVLNPESFDSVTGILGAEGDPSPIRAPFELRNNFYFNTANRLQVTTDNATGEPSTWQVQEVEKVGSLSSRASAPSGEGEDWQFVASRGGVYIFSGSTPIKISQEIQRSDSGIQGWDDINWAAESSIWMVNDPVKRRLYVAVPMTNTEAPAWTAPSLLFVMDYKNLESAEAIAGTPPLRNDGRGSLTTFDLGRKWTRWNCFLDCGAILNRGSNSTDFVVGSGNGATPGNSAAHGNIYTFSHTKFQDDDYGQISPYYTTAFLAPNLEAQATGIGVHRKQAAYLTAFLTGQGNMVVTPLVDTLQNAWSSTPLLPMTTTQSFDTEIGLNVLGERIAFQWTPQATDAGDVQFNLSEMCVTFRPDPWSLVRGAFSFNFLIQETGAGTTFLLEDSTTSAILLEG